MTFNEARSLVARLNSELLRSGLAIATNPLIPVRMGDRVRLTWPQAKNGHGVFADQRFATLAEYRTFASEGHYTCLLNEGSLIQISFDFKNNEMVANRLCFYPCPLQLSENDYPHDFDMWNDLLESELTGQIATLEPDSEAAEEAGLLPRAGLLRLRSPLRFDFESDDRGSAEPASHVHINESGARIPVHAALSLGEFIAFVISHYFPAYSNVLKEFEPDFSDRSISAEDEGRLHVDCRRAL